MTVSNGQLANQNTFNSAFMSRTSDDGTLGKKDLQSAAPESGPSIINVQRNINRVFSLLGDAPNGPYNDLMTWASTALGGNATSVKAKVDNLVADAVQKTLQLARATSTGVLSGLTLSVNGGDNTKFDIAPGKYDIAVHTDIDNPVITSVNFAGQTAVTVTNLGTQPVTYISLDASGNIIQTSSYPTPSQRRSYAFVGRLNHSNLTNISFADTFPDFKISPVGSFYDLVDALAPFRISGLQITPSGANLSFNRASGSVFFRSANVATDITDPHTRTYPQQTLQPFRKMTRTTTVDVADVTVLDPANYDNAGVVTALGGGPNTSTIQRVYVYKSGAVRVTYGQTHYPSLEQAINGLASETFVENDTVEQTAVLVAFIVLTRTCTSLQDTVNCKIVPADRFGGAGGGAGGGGGTVGITVSGIQTLTDLSNIAIQDVPRQRVKVQGDAPDTQLFLPNGTRPAQELYVQGMSDSNSFYIDGSNVKQNGTRTFYANSMELYIWDEVGSFWQKVGE